MQQAILAENLRKDFSGEQALDGVSLSVDEGSLFGIIGADGAGKTTLLKILTTLLAPDSGTATLLGHDIAASYRSIRPSIGYMPQRFSLYEDLSVMENIRFFADLFGVTGQERKERVDRLLEFSRLSDYTTRRARNLSGGMKQKLSLCCALVHTPSILILDEPTTGVDPLSRREFWEILQDLHQQGITVVVSTPYMTETVHCTDLLLMHEGRVLRNGPPERMIEECPITTFRVTSESEALNVPHSRRMLACGATVYPVAGALHIAAPGSTVPALETMLTQVKELAPSAKYIEPSQATIEDLFFHYLSVPDTVESSRAPR